MAAAILSAGLPLFTLSVIGQYNRMLPNSIQHYRTMFNIMSNVTEHSSTATNNIELCWQLSTRVYHTRYTHTWTTSSNVTERYRTLSNDIKGHRKITSEVIEQHPKSDRTKHPKLTSKNIEPYWTVLEIIEQYRAIENYQTLPNDLRSSSNIYSNVTGRYRALYKTAEYDRTVSKTIKHVTLSNDFQKMSNGIEYSRTILRKTTHHRKHHRMTQSRTISDVIEWRWKLPINIERTRKITEHNKATTVKRRAPNSAGWIVVLPSYHADEIV